MPLRLASAAAGFARDFARLLELKRAMAEDVDAAVTSIVADVRKRGDEALIDYTTVSYTHLDVYKRQPLVRERSSVQS